MLEINTLTLTDPIYKEKPKYNFIERFIISLLNDKRDLPFISLSAIIFFTTVPFAVYLFLPGKFHWWLVPIYYIFNIAFLTGPFILMLHNTSHRPLFKKKYKFLNHTIPWVMSPFFGETPESYFAHHLGMHHAEGNMPEDHSSTMKYQRDSFIDFMKYYSDFMVFGVYELAKYLKIKKRNKIRKDFLLGEFTFWVFAIGLCFLNWKASVAVFILPVFITRFLMLAGNWGQHAFIDPQSPDNSFVNSTNCINSRYNRQCWNDGYHIVHHLKPAMHWTELPGEFMKNIPNYIKESSIIFSDLDFFQVWFLLMLKRYDTLANKMVNTGHMRSKEEAIAFLKMRTKRFES